MPSHPHWRTEAVRYNAETLLRNTAGTDGARPKHGALARRKYGLLAPMGQAVDPVAAGNQVSGDGHEATRGTAKRAQRDTEAGE